MQLKEREMDPIFRVARNVIQTRYEDIPDNVVEATKKEILDCLGVGLAGSSASGVGELVELAKEWGGSGQSSVICYGIKVPVPNAAQANAAMIHARDYDDGHAGALVHPGVVSVVTCFAVAERKGRVNGKEFITAVTLSTDLMCRLGLATKPEGSLATAGWHFTTLYGFLSAAAAAGRILGLNEDKMVNALGIAYHQCSGNMQCVLDGALTKRMGPGFAAKGGITAALMAEKGITGAKNCLEGEMGVYNLYHRGGYDAAALTADLGKRFEGLNVSTKPYPCCGITHPFIDAALALVSEHNIRPDEIHGITAFHGEGSRVLCEPLEVKQKPRNLVDAQFSIPWAVAVAVVKKRVSIADFSEAAIKDEDILGISQKVIPQVDASLNRKAVEPGRVEITTKGGEAYSKQVDNPLGSPLNPMTFDDCVSKFLDCAAYSVKHIPDEKLDKVVELIKELERVDDVTEIMGEIS